MTGRGGGLNYKGAKGMTVFGGPCKKNLWCQTRKPQGSTSWQLGGGRGGALSLHHGCALLVGGGTVLWQG